MSVSLKSGGDTPETIESSQNDRYHFYIIKGLGILVKSLTYYNYIISETYLCSSPNRHLYSNISYITLFCIPSGSCANWIAISLSIFPS